MLKVHEAYLTLPDVVVAAGGGPDNAGVLVDGLEELADHEGNRLDPLHLLLGMQVFLLQIPLLVLNIHHLFMFMH